MFMFHPKWATFKLTYSGNEEKKKFFLENGLNIIFSHFQMCKTTSFCGHEVMNKNLDFNFSLKPATHLGNIPNSQHSNFGMTMQQGCQWSVV